MYLPGYVLVQRAVLRYSSPLWSKVGPQKIYFNAIADALEWILLHNGVTSLMHYLDDFLTLGSPQSVECRENLQAIKPTSQNIGLPLKEEKV